MKKTRWYPAHINPVRIGWYEVKGCEWFMDCAGFHYWDYKGWWAKSCVGMMPVGHLKWRGIAK